MNNNPTTACYGFCTTCNQKHSIPIGNAKKHCLDLMTLLKREGRIDLAVSANKADPRLSLDYLFGNARGQMFGVLECHDQDGNTVLLKAFSSQYNGIWDVAGWAPPLFEASTFDSTIAQADKRIKHLDKRIADNSTPRDDKDTLIKQRKAISQQSMKAIQDIYRLTNFNHETCTLHDAYISQNGMPSGTGDCCAPKLLNHAAKNNLTPVGMAEFYLGKENKSKTRAHQTFYASCDDKCQPILGFMLCGATKHDAIDIVYRDEHLVVVNKPSGLLSVPGRGDDKQYCVTSIIQSMFPNCIEHPAVHRLDMDTSGLLLLALTKEAHKHLSMQFEARTVKKEYVALLDGIIKETSGEIKLPFRLDVDNRPYQIYDAQHGKMGITRWERLGIEDGKTRIKFMPLTGRTHQLRVHAAHPLGLGTPIVGDKLYGNATEHGKLKLHACKLTFIHPASGKEISLEISSSPQI